MAIISVQELGDSLPELSLDNPESSILAAQVIAEGINGSRRPLEKTLYTEVFELRSDGVIRLANYPIDPEDPITVEVRSAVDSSFQTFEESNYTVDYELEQIQLNNFQVIPRTRFSVYRSGQFRNRNYLNRRRTQTPEHEIKVSYTAGYDFFETPLSNEANQLKQALIQIVRIKNSQFSSGLRQFVTNDFVSNTFSSELAQLSAASTGNTLVEDYLQVFQQYRSKEFST